jgi:hypothetical protein
MSREERARAARTIVAEAEKATTPKSIDMAPEVPERTLLLFCPEQGGWQAGQWRHGRWVLTASVDVELKPTHWRELPPDPEASKVKSPAYKRR